jgi:very-short-patch-repair endonuclease
LPSEKLIIEIDGGIQENQKEYDSDRSAILTNMGYGIIRFENMDVFERWDHIEKTIMDILTTE